MSEAPQNHAFGEAVLDGWALAAAIDGGSEALSCCAPAFASALTSRLEALANPQSKIAALRAWSRRVSPEVDALTLRAIPPKARALLAPLASVSAQRDAARELRSVPSPRPGYRPPPGLADSLAVRVARSVAEPGSPNVADRGRGRRTLAALGSDDDRANALLARAGVEADAVERLAELAGGDADDDPAVPFMLEAAKAHRDPVGRLGQLLGGQGAAARELQELEAACRE